MAVLGSFTCWPAPMSPAETVTRPGVVEAMVPVTTPALSVGAVGWVRMAPGLSAESRTNMSGAGPPSDWMIVTVTVAVSRPLATTLPGEAVMVEAERSPLEMGARMLQLHIPTQTPNHAKD